MSHTYAHEQDVAVAAVRRACALTASVFNKLVKNETLTKDDKSPVTGAWGTYHSHVWLTGLHVVVGDFSAQAVINTILSRAFPDDPIVGEEDAADLRADSGVALRNRIVELANETITAPLQHGETDAWGIGPSHAQTPEQIMDIIDRGNYGGGRTGRKCFALLLVSSPSSLSFLFVPSCIRSAVRCITA